MPNKNTSGDVGQFVRELEDYLIFGDYANWKPRIADYGRQFGEENDKTFLFRSCGDFHLKEQEYEDNLLTSDDFQVARNRIVDGVMKRVYKISQYASAEPRT